MRLLSLRPHAKPDVTDPETYRTYVVVSAEVYERLLRDEEDRREQAAFLRAAKKNAKARLMEDA